MRFLMVAIVLYNPNSLVRPFRTHELAHEFLSNNDLVVLPGTCIGRDDRESRMQRLEHGAQVQHFGCSRGRHTNKSAGISVFLNKKFAKMQTNVYVPPQEIGGRAVGMRFRDYSHDITLIAIYFPSKHTRLLKLKMWKEAVSAVLKWVEELLHKLPQRSTPILLGDFNDSLGNLSPGDEFGEHRHGTAGFAGEGIGRILQDHFLCAADTFYDLGPSFHSWHGTPSWIDHICLPRSAMATVKSMSMMIMAARRVQIMPDQQLRDHVPMRMVLHYHLQSQPSFSRVRWNQDKIAMMYQTGEYREEFLADANSAIFSVLMDMSQVGKMSTVDEHYRLFRVALQPVVEKHFASQKQLYKESAEWQAYKKKRDELLEEQRSLRMEGDGSQQVREELRFCTREMRRVQRRHWAWQRECWDGELREAWQRRDTRRVHEISRRLSKAGLGPKKKRYDSIQKANPTKSEWTALLELPGAQGGLGGHIINFDDIVRELTEDREHVWCRLRQ